MTGDANMGRYVHALALFVVGVTLLGHGMAATVLVGGALTVETVALPALGSALAYHSLVGLLPEESPFASTGLLVALAAATTVFANAVVPTLYSFAYAVPALPVAPRYWEPFVVTVSGFTALGVYEILAARVAVRPYAMSKLFGAALVATGTAVALAVGLSKPPLAATGTLDAAFAVAGAAMGAMLFDVAKLGGAGSR